MTIDDGIRGALYGVAIGDALGAPLEFMNADAIQREHGTVRDMIGGGWLDMEPGEITDDTQMTFAVAGGIFENPDSPVEAIGERFVAWYNSSPKDVGYICSAAIRGAISMAKNKKRPSKAEWEAAAERARGISGGFSAGNGSLMRTIYPALYYTDEKDVIRHAEEISRMTHYDDRATEVCAYYCKMIHEIIKEFDVLDRFRIFDAFVRDYSVFGFVSEPEFRNIEIKPTGYVLDSFDAAMKCVNRTGRFEDALVMAVNLGGDADTIGAITGGLAGSLYGFNSIPKRWIDALSAKDKSHISALCDAAIDVRRGK